jgi:hypothetical protein
MRRPNTAPILAAIAGLVLIPLLIAGCSTSSSTAGPSATPTTPVTTAPPQPTAVSELTQRYWSRLQGYSIAVAPTWKIHPAASRWTHFPPEDTPRQNDLLVAPDHSNWAITSITPPPGMSGKKWAASWAKPQPGSGDPAGCTTPLSDYRPIDVAGHPGWVHGALPICNFTEAVVVVGNRVYVFTAHPSMATVDDHVYPPKMFRAVLASVKFTGQG